MRPPWPLRSIKCPGVVENGLFINICDRVILGASDGRIEEHLRP